KTNPSNQLAAFAKLGIDLHFNDEQPLRLACASQASWVSEVVKILLDDGARLTHSAENLITMTLAHCHAEAAQRLMDAGVSVMRHSSTNGDGSECVISEIT